MSLSTLSLVVFIAVFLITVLVFLFFDEVGDRKYRKEKEGLFDGWEESIYDLLFSKTDPKIVSKKFGFDGEQYLFNCDISRMNQNLKSVIVQKIVGLILIVAACIVYFVTKNIYIAVILLFAGLLMYEFRTGKAKTMAKERRAALRREIPRFADMLETGLSINLPIEQAISLATQYLPGTVLAEEFTDSLIEMEIGSSSWQDALQKIAVKYQDEDFSDFVLAIVTAYKKGTPIYDVVKQKSEEMKQSNLAAMREKSSKMNSVILFPITVFKLLPLIALMVIPVIVQLRDSNF